MILQRRKGITHITHLEVWGYQIISQGCSGQRLAITLPGHRLDPQVDVARDQHDLDRDVTVALHRGGKMEVLEGAWPFPRCVVLKFPDMAAAKAWHGSAEYAGPLKLRQAAARSNLIVVEGL